MSDVLVRTLWVLVVIAAIAATLWAMRRGWIHRQQRQADVAAPQDLPTDLGAIHLGPVTGRFVGSVNAGDWLDRIAVHDLGVRSPARCEVTDAGLVFWRDGACDVFIPRADIRGVRADRGIAGRVQERGGVLVVTWDLGGRLIDSGFRADVGDDQEALVAAVESVIAEEWTS
jgi:hypothetical protein